MTGERYDEILDMFQAWLKDENNLRKLTREAMLYESGWEIGARDMKISGGELDEFLKMRQRLLDEQEERKPKEPLFHSGEVEAMTHACYAMFLLHHQANAERRKRGEKELTFSEAYKGMGPF